LKIKPKDIPTVAMKISGMHSWFTNSWNV